MYGRTCKKWIPVHGTEVRCNEPAIAHVHGSPGYAWDVCAEHVASITRSRINTQQSFPVTITFFGTRVTPEQGAKVLAIYEAKEK